MIIIKTQTPSFGIVINNGQSLSYEYQSKDRERIVSLQFYNLTKNVHNYFNITEFSVKISNNFLLRPTSVLWKIQHLNLALFWQLFCANKKPLKGMSLIGDCYGSSHKVDDSNKP